MSRILAIDPGSEKSGYVLVRPGPLLITDHTEVILSGKLENSELRALIRGMHFGAIDVAVIEFTKPRGERAYAQLFEALFWAGRFAECLERTTAVERWDRLDRIDVKKHLLGKTTGDDSAIIHVLIDRFGGIGGRAAAVGVKASPGPLYGVKTDAWQALALALTYADTVEVDGAR
jgi:hypothetical protein